MIPVNLGILFYISRVHIRQKYSANKTYFYPFCVKKCGKWRKKVFKGGIWFCFFPSGSFIPNVQMIRNKINILLTGKFPLSSFIAKERQTQ